MCESDHESKQTVSNDKRDVQADRETLVVTQSPNSANSTEKHEIVEIVNNDEEQIGNVKSDVFWDPCKYLTIFTKFSSNNENKDQKTLEFVLGMPFISDPNFAILNKESKRIVVKKYLEHPESKIDFDEKVIQRENEFKDVNPLCKRPCLDHPLTYKELHDYGEFILRDQQFLNSDEASKYQLGSRLFIGRLDPNEANQKLLLWRIFSQYGTLLNVVVKGKIAFCQFKTVQQCALAIAGESNVPLNGKLLELRVSEPPKSKPIDKKNTSTVIEYKPLSGKRGLNRVDKRDSKKQKSAKIILDSNLYSKMEKSTVSSGVDCQIFVKKQADIGLVNALVQQLNGAGISNATLEVTRQQSVKQLANEAAYSGVMGIVIVHRDGNLDVQIFQNNQNGGLNFDEYQAVTLDVAVQLLVREKSLKHLPRPSVASYDSKPNRYLNSQASLNIGESNGGSYNNDYVSPTNHINRFNSHAVYNNHEGQNSQSFLDNRSSFNNQGTFNDNDRFNNTSDVENVKQRVNTQVFENSELLNTLKQFDTGSLQNLLTMVQNTNSGQLSQSSYQSVQQNTNPNHEDASVQTLMDTLKRLQQN